MHVMALFKPEKSPSSAACSFLVPPPHTQRFQTQAGQLLVEDVTQFVPGLVDTSYKPVTVRRNKAGANVK